MNNSIKRNLLLIKLGGSVITDKSKKYTSKPENIKRFAREIKSALNSFNGMIILGHGAGSFAHIPASKYKTKQGLINKESLYGMSVTEEAARELNSIVIRNFLKEKVPVFAFSPASFLISDSEVYKKSYLDPVILAMLKGQIPVVYGDVILDKKIGCTIFSTEKIFRVFVKELRNKYRIRIINVTNVDGVYDESKVTIPEINSKNFKSLKNSIIGTSTTDVTGGMLNKVEEALKISRKFNVKTLIINGKVNGNLKKAILEQKVKGTLITN